MEWIIAFTAGLAATVVGGQILKHFERRDQKPKKKKVTIKIVIKEKHR